MNTHLTKHFRLAAMMMAIIICLSCALLPGSAAQAADITRPIAANNKPEGDPGYLYLTKTASTTSIKDVWKITLTVGGMPPPPVYVDIMVALDTSDSMNYVTDFTVRTDTSYTPAAVYLSDSPIYLTKKAAKLLVNTIWDGDPAQVQYRIGMGAFKFVWQQYNPAGPPWWPSHQYDYMDIMDPTIIPTWQGSHSELNPTVGGGAETALISYSSTSTIPSTYNTSNNAYPWLTSSVPGVKGVNPVANKANLIRNIELLLAAGNATPTHYALNEAADSLYTAADPRPMPNTANAVWKKVIVLITDGQPYQDWNNPANIGPTFFDTSSAGATDINTLVNSTHNGILGTIFVDHSAPVFPATGPNDISKTTAAVANVIRNNDIELYTVGINLQGNTAALMEYVATTSDHYGNRTETGAALDRALTAQFKQIIENLKKSGDGTAHVYDTIAEQFELFQWPGTTAPGEVEYSYWQRNDPTKVPPTANQLKYANKRFDWQIDVFAPNTDPDTLTYYVKLRAGYNLPNSTQSFATNGYAYIDYLNTDGVRAVKYFPNPFITPDGEPEATPEVNEFQGGNEFDIVGYSPTKASTGWGKSKIASASGETEAKPEVVTKEQQQALEAEQKAAEEAQKAAEEAQKEDEKTKAEENGRFEVEEANVDEDTIEVPATGETTKTISTVFYVFAAMSVGVSVFIATRKRKYD